MKKISFKLFWKQDLVRVTLTGDTLEVENPSTNPVPFVVNDETATAHVGQRASVSY